MNDSGRVFLFFSISTLCSWLFPTLILWYLRIEGFVNPLTILLTTVLVTISYIFFQIIKRKFRAHMKITYSVFTFILLVIPCIFLIMRGVDIPVQFIFAIILGYFVSLEVEYVSGMGKSCKKAQIVKIFRIVSISVVLTVLVMGIALSSIRFVMDKGFMFLSYIQLLFTPLTVLSLATMLPKVSYKRETISEEIVSIWSKYQLVSFLTASMVVLAGCLGAYWNEFSLLGINHAREYQVSEVFSNYLGGGVEVTSTVSHNDIIAYLQDITEPQLDTLAILSLMTGNVTYGQRFEDILLEEVREHKFVGISGSVKAWQYDLMIRVYYYYKITQEFPTLFNNTEKAEILEWLRVLNEQVFLTTFADVYYGLSFKKIPDGIYENQEIGLGLVSALSKALENYSPSLAETNIAYIEKNGVGWDGNYRNTDDGAVYHHTIWIKNAYLMSMWGGQKNTLGNTNCMLSFEWLLAIWPSNGMSPAFNYQGWQTPFDILTLGANIFRDGRYRWLAERMFQYMVSNNVEKRGYWFGLELWDDTITPLMPNYQSGYVKGTTGLNSHVGPLRPDKIVLRSGWDYDSSYFLLNLRSSGWHGYKATNCIVSYAAGAPFLVEGLPDISYDWLPAGIADYRDYKIDRFYLNGLQLGLSQSEKFLYGSTGIGYNTSQAIPDFAFVKSFVPFSSGVVSRTIMNGWQDWHHTRTVLLVDGLGLLVVDSASGLSKRSAFLTWHFKGEIIDRENGFVVSQSPYNITVLDSTYRPRYETKLIPESRLYIGSEYIHAPDYLFSQYSSNTIQFGSLMVLLPNIDTENVTVNGHDVYSENNEYSDNDILGQFSFGSNRYYLWESNTTQQINYGNVKSDASFAFINASTTGVSVLLLNLERLSIHSELAPSQVTLNGFLLDEGTHWVYQDNNIIFQVLFPEVSEVVVTVG